MITGSLLLAFALGVQEAAPPVGKWDAWLQSPGGQLEFGLEIEREGEAPRAFVTNGDERIPVPDASFGETIARDGEQKLLVLRFDHFDSEIVAGLHDGKLDGVWKKRVNDVAHAYMPFRAEPASARSVPRLPEGAPRVDGRWAVAFDKSEDPAVGIFETAADGTLRGTFLTTTGDYRYLSGTFDGSSLVLSCFDGAHAFLFKANLVDEETLAGMFWSRDRYRERWRARRDPEAKLPDAFGLTTWTGELALGDLAFPDLDGKVRRLDDPAFAGKARIIQVFGSWCPNCHDEARYLVELEERYGPRGLSILGLAFELTTSFDGNVEQVRRYQARTGADWPVLIAGPADKRKASEAFPALDRIRSFPTTIFLDGKGKVRAVHTGFAGPATGEEHRKLRAEFERILDEILGPE